MEINIHDIVKLKDDPTTWYVDHIRGENISETSFREYVLHDMQDRTRIAIVREELIESVL